MAFSFEPSEPKQQRKLFVGKVLVQIWKGRCARLAAVLGAAAMVFAALSLTLIYERVGSDSCEEVEIVDLPMHRILLMKRRKEAYQRNPNRVHFWLSAEELTFILGGQENFQLHLWFSNKTTTADVVLWHDERCYEIKFVGDVEVVHGEIRLTPAKISIGELDLSWLLSGVPVVVASSDVDEPWLREGLNNVRAARIENNQALIEFIDPWKIPW